MEDPHVIVHVRLLVKKNSPRTQLRKKGNDLQGFIELNQPGAQIIVQHFAVA